MMNRGKTAGPKYAIGQQVIIQPVNENSLTQRDSDLNIFAGKVGQVSNFYSSSPSAGQIFHMYKVRVGSEKKEIVVYEDEMEPKLQ